MTSISRWNWQQADWPNWRFDASAFADMENRFLLQSGRLLGARQHLDPSEQVALKVGLLSDEAMQTSRIEGEYLNLSRVQSSVRRQFGLAADRRAGAAEAGIAELMVDCFNGFDDPLTHDMLFEWNRLVCAGRSDLNVVGGYRTHVEPMQVISGPTYKPKVHFEAPLSDRIHGEMSAFIDWFGNSDLPALVKAGLAHVYFVSIHPFEDGNGRIARALSEKVLAMALGQPSLLALSIQIEKDRKGYYSALEAGSKGMEVTDWLLWFAQTVLKAQTYSIALVDHIIAKAKMFDRLRGQLNERQEKVLLRLFEAGPEGFTGGLSAKNYMTITAAAPATARRDLVDLVAKGALRRTGERRGTRYWLAVDDREA